MTEYEMMIKMLQRVDPDGSWCADPEHHIITLMCDDGWYDRTFIFNEEGELVKFD